MQSPDSASFEAGNRSKRAALLFVVGASILIVAAVALVALTYLRQGADFRTTAATQSLARSLTQTIEGVIDNIDVVLLVSADEIAKQLATGKPSTQAISLFLAQQRERVPHLDVLRASNEQGDAIYGPATPTPPASNADRDYFQRLKQDPAAGLLIVKPIVGKISQKWIWLMARRISKADGSFGGVIYGSIYVDDLNAMLAQIKMEPGSVITLRDAEMGVIARSAFSGANSIQPGDKQLSTPFRNALRENPLEGSYTSDGTTADGISRMYSYRRSDKYGFTVLVGIDVDTALAEWRKQVWLIAGLVLAFIAASLSFSWMIRRAWQRQEIVHAAIAASQRSLHEAQQIASLGHFSYDLRNGSWTSSAILDDILGIDGDYPRDLKHWLQLIAPETRADMQAYMQHIVRNKLAFDREYCIVRQQDGQIRWLQGKGKIEYDAQGSPQILKGTAQDITGRKRIEVALRESESRYRRFADDLPLGIVITQTGLIKYVNSATVDMIGYSEFELLEKPFIPFICAADRPRVLDLHQRRMKGEQVAPSYTVGMVRKDGELRQWQMFVSSIELDGKPSALGTVIDVTKMMQAEADLVAARQAAESASSAKTRFLAAASHDLRQPIQAIGLFSDALGRTELTEEQRRLWQYSALSIHALEDLLNALLDISKLDAGLVKPYPKAIPVETLFRQIDAEFSPLASTKRLRFKLYFPLQEISVFADPSLVQSLLGNLIGNAIKYTQQGGVLVGIRQRGAQMLVQVWDTGLGIAPEHLHNIFEEYFQIGNPERDRAKGLGLGLSIAKRIARLLNTSIVCRSLPGKGSVFEFRLPVEKRQASRGPLPSATKTYGAGAISSLDGRRVVVVEDDWMVAEATRISLQSYGLQVRIFANGEDALASPDITDADFYISDFRLTGMNGLQFLDTVQSRLSRPLKAVLLTGDTSPERMELTQSSRWKVLFKPINLPLLLSAMEVQFSQYRDIESLADEAI